MGRYDQQTLTDDEVAISMWMGQRRKELDVHLEGKRHQHNQFCVVGGAVCGDDNTDTEMCKRIAASANA